MTLADDIAAVIADVRDDLPDAMFASIISIAESQVVTDAGGGRTEEWVIVGMERGYFHPLGSSAGQERVVADQLGWTVPYVIDVAIDTAITPANRVIVDGRTFEVGAGPILGGEWAVTATVVVRERG